MQDCIRIGIDIDTFWTLDFDEIGIYFEVYAKKEKDRLKEQANFSYKQAELVGIFVSSMFGNKKIPTVEEVFPGLFDDVEKKTPQGQDEIQLLAFAKAWNAKRQGVTNGINK